MTTYTETVLSLEAANRRIRTPAKRDAVKYIIEGALINVRDTQREGGILESMALNSLTQDEALLSCFLGSIAVLLCDARAQFWNQTFAAADHAGQVKYVRRWFLNHGVSY